MGLLDRLFGNAATRNPASPAPARRPLPETKPQPKPSAAPPAAEKERELAPPCEAEVTVQTAPAVAQPETVAPVAPVVETAIVAEAAPVTAVVETAIVAEAAPEAVEEPADTAITPHLQARLDTYFARLRREFPDGCIVRLNTGHKKLAERGAELRRLTGYEGRLDEFFALGGFTYQRSAGGRPPLPTAQTETVEERLRAAFPDDVPTTLAVRQADPRLYLDLRAAARRDGCTVGEYLNRFRAD